MASVQRVNDLIGYDIETDSTGKLHRIADLPTKLQKLHKDIVFAEAFLSDSERYPKGHYKISAYIDASAPKSTRIHAISNVLTFLANQGAIEGLVSKLLGSIKT